MISTQRLVLMFILMNILVGICVGIYENPKIFSLNKVNEEINIMEDRQVEFEEDGTEFGGIPTTDTSGEGKTIGNPLKMGALIWDMFVGALNPFSITPNMFELTIEKIIATLITFFRLLGSTLVLIEIYLLMKNKKAT